MQLAMANPADERSMDFGAVSTPGGINHLAFSADGRLMAAARTDMTVDLFCGDKLSNTFQIVTHDEKVRTTQRIRGIAFGNANDRLIVAGADHVRCIPLCERVREWSFVAKRSFGFLVVSPLSISVSSRDFVVAAFDGGCLGVWSPEGNQVFLVKEPNTPRSVDFAQNDGLVVGTDGFSLCSWYSMRGIPRLKKLLGERVYHSTCWRKGSRVAVRSVSSVSVLDILDGKLVWRCTTDVGLPLLAFHEDTGRLAVPSEHGVCVFDEAGQEVARVSVTGAAVTSVAFDPLSGDVVLGKADGDLNRIQI